MDSASPSMLATLSSFVALALAALQTPAVERSGAHYKVVSHLAQERLADEALAAAEAAWPLALEALGLEKDAKPAKPLVIHLYPDAASYEAAEQPLTGGAFKKNLSFSHFATMSTHVALQPPCSPAVLDELGLPALTAYLIAHEASHLASYAFAPNALDFPDWFAEGMATYAGAAAMGKLGRMRPGDAEPFTAKSAVNCQAMRADGTLPEAEKILMSTVGELEFYRRYSVDDRFYALLRAKHGAELAKTVAAIRAQGDGASYADGLRNTLGDLWKARALATLQKEWLAAVNDAKPEWDEVFRSLESRGEGWVQRAFDEKNAVAFRTSGPTSLPFTARGTVRLLPGAGRQMNFLLGRTEKGFLSVALTFPIDVTVFHHEAGAKEEWKVLAKAPCPALVPGQDVAFRIEASAAELVVFVAEKEIVRAPLGGRSPLGPWGFGAQTSTTGEWKGVEVKEAKGKKR